MVARFGLDPEVAIVNKTTGIGRSAHQFIDKKEVFTFYVDNKKGNNSIKGSEVERDGAAIEVRSIVDSACRDNIIPYVAEALRQTSLKLDKFENGQFKLSTAASFELDKESFINAPEDVSEFGCQPDYDAYTLQVKSPSCPPGSTTRFTGGHIHASTFGGANSDIKEQAAIAMLFDYLVAVPMVAILGNKFAAGEAERRAFYGQPGSFRWDTNKKKIEFRTLSGRVLLHPTILAWAMGAIKMFSGLGKPVDRSWGNSIYSPLLKDVLMPNIPVEKVYETIMNHDVDAARDISSTVFSLLPSYKQDPKFLANPMSGGGGGTTNPFFFEQALRVFIEAEKEGLLWDDDMVKNWGLYKNYMPTHHSYWGVQVAMVGLCDSDIFPANAILPKIWPADLIQKTPIFTHPLNGGKMQYVTPSARWWLQ